MDKDPNVFVTWRSAPFPWRLVLAALIVAASIAVLMLGAYQEITAERQHPAADYLEAR
jgi:hypothetical protein